MKRLLLPAILVIAATLMLSAQSKQASKAAAPPRPFTIVEASIADMRTAMEQRRVTSRELVLQCLVRIATYEDRLNAVIAVNPNALEEAAALDRERAQGKVRGPLHGIPVLI